MHFGLKCGNIAWYRTAPGFGRLSSLYILKGVTDVKQGIHPQYDVATVKCACGAEFETRSTKKEIRVDICSKCHPFFTGKQKLVDTGGRVDRFKKRFNLEEK